MAEKDRKYDPDSIAAVYIETGNVSKTAERIGCSRGAVQNVIRERNLFKPIAGGKKKGVTKEIKADLPTRGAKRYILTCAQNNVKAHPEFLANLLALRAHYDAELLISRITYNTNAYTSQPSKPGKKTQAQLLADKLWYDPALEPYFSDDRVLLAPGLVWCGEANILPTAERPLRGLETYTGRKSGIFPHTKIAMESIASGKYEPTKFNYTTGAVTQMAYIQRKAGQKAEFHHSYGALLVEVDKEGRWYVRQLNATSDGAFYDLTLQAKDGAITDGHHAEAVTWGDVHVEQTEEEVERLAWAEGGMLDTLRPRVQFVHDTVSFHRRNHHNRGNPHIMFEKHVLGQESVEEELRSVVRFLNVKSYRTWCKTIVVDSNHDNALEKWLREADYKTDPVNAEFFLTAQARKYRAIRLRDTGFHMVEWALRDHLGCRKDIQFLREDESYITCRDAHGGIENGMHGHLGPNGARGSPSAFARMGRKANTAHTHSAGIIDGLYTAGTSSLLDMGFNRGPSSWSHAHIVTYKNGKRAIVTMWAGAWRAA